MAADPILRHLAPGERIVWRQMAPAGRTIRAKFVGILVSIPFAGLGTGAVLVSAAAVGSGDFQFMGVAIGSLFCLLGYGGIAYGVPDLLFGWRTDYARSDQRLMIVSRGHEAKAFGSEAFDQLERTSDERHGSLRFNWTSAEGLNSTFRQSLIGLREPARVEALILATLKKGKGQRA